MGHCVNWVVGKRYTCLASFCWRHRSCNQLTFIIRNFLHLLLSVSFPLSPDMNHSSRHFPVAEIWVFHRARLTRVQNDPLLLQKSFIQMNILQMSRFFLQKNKFESFPLSHLFCLFLPVSYGQLACAED